MKTGYFKNVNRGVLSVLLGTGVVVLSVGGLEAKAKQRRDNQGTQPAATAPNNTASQNNAANPNNAADHTRKGFRQTGNHMDECLATKVIHANQNEIRASQIAQEKSGTPAVKQFAQMMVQQHQEFLAKLEPFGKAGQTMTNRNDKNQQTVGYRFKNQQDADAANRNNNNKATDNANPNQANQTKIQQTGGTTEVTVNRNDNNSVGAFHHQLGQIEQELAQQCRQSMEKELNSKTGADFDACYVGMQIAAHMHMLDTLTVFERHASPELKAVLDQGRQTTQTHLDHAKSLMETLAKNAKNPSNAPAGSK